MGFFRLCFRDFDGEDSGIFIGERIGCVFGE